MKIKLKEYGRAFAFECEPENVAETTLLMRMAKNRKKVSPYVKFYFGGDTPELAVNFQKVHESTINDSIG